MKNKNKNENENKNENKQQNENKNEKTVTRLKIQAYLCKKCCKQQYYKEALSIQKA